MGLTVSILDELEAQIRANQAPKLHQLVETIKPQDIPRSLMARYTNLLRRMGETKYAFKLLNPLMYNQVNKPSTFEIIEYTSCLARLGLEDESIARLMKIKDEPNPEISYVLAMSYVSKWDYPNAIIYFEKYLKYKSLGLYQVYVGKINLAASYFYTNNFEKADSILHEILPALQKSGFNLLWGNVLQLLGQIAIIRRDFENADNFFNEAQEKLMLSNPRYRLYLDAWVIIGYMLRDNGSKESLAKWELLRKKTVKLSDWNTLREIELFKSIATNDEEAVKKLYYGVPYPEFRKRILLMWQKPFNLDAYHERQIGQGVFHPKKIFDVSSGKDTYTGCNLKPGQTLHRLVQVMSSDFYAPFLTTRIFSLVYPGSSFNPNTSPQQVYEIVKKLNRWFLKNKTPLLVHRSKFGYRLRATDAYTLRIQNSVGVLVKIDDFVNNLIQHGLTEKFSLRMVEEKLGLPNRTASRLLSESVASGKLVRQGKSQSTVYFLALKKAV